MINPRLTRDWEGYVYWDGKQVEHYSYPLEQMEEQAHELTDRCLHLESIGVPVSSLNAIWNWPRFATMTADHWLKQLLIDHSNWYESEGGVGYVDNSNSALTGDIYQHEAVFWYFNGSVWRHFDILSDNLGGFYHPLKALGWNIPKCGQGKDLGMCYATLEGIEAMFARHGFTKDQL